MTLALNAIRSSVLREDATPNRRLRSGPSAPPWIVCGHTSSFHRCLWSLRGVELLTESIGRIFAARYRRSHPTRLAEGGTFRVGTLAGLLADGPQLGDCPRKEGAWVLSDEAHRICTAIL